MKSQLAGHGSSKTIAVRISYFRKSCASYGIQFLIYVGLGIACLGLLSSCGDDSTAPEETGFQADTLFIDVAMFPMMPIPHGNPVTRQGVELGRMLYYDPIFSADSTMACATCHAHAFAFTDHGKRFSVGVDGTVGTRNAPTLTNVGWEPVPSWDGGVRSVESMVLATIPHPGGMQSNWPTALAKLDRHPEYPRKFEAAFGTKEITPDHVAMAIAQFTRTFISNNSKFDRWQRGETQLTESELRGFELFYTEKGDCFHCHGSILFSDFLFHDDGLDEEIVDLGLGAVTQNPFDDGKFKTPTLRNLAFTAPYMHDGRFATLGEVIDHYNSGGFGSANVDPLIRVGIGLGLTEQDKEDLIAFILTLSDSSFVQNPDLANPF